VLLPSSSPSPTVWRAPVRAILVKERDMAPWLASNTKAEVVRFVKLLASATAAQAQAETSLASSCASTCASASWSGGVAGMVALLGEVEVLVKEFPPAKQPMRFGNRAFADWHARVVVLAPALLRKLAAAASTSTSTTAATRKVLEGNFEEELSAYLTGSFGDPTRIDYGTGHETCFLSLLYCLGRVGVFDHSDAAHLVTVVFARYMRVMGCLQRTYVLEPAGSHGVWGLDDYHCLPFLFGAAQLMGLCEGAAASGGEGEERGGGDIRGRGGAVESSLASPSCVGDDSLLRRFSPHVMDAYDVQKKGEERGGDKEDGGEEGPRGVCWLYLDAVATVRSVKRGAPFSETSPMLHALANLPSWRQVFVGLLKHFEVEVLGKFPVIQHFKFGTLLPASWAPAANPGVAASASGAPAFGGGGGGSLPAPPSFGVDVAPWAATTKR